MAYDYDYERERYGRRSRSRYGNERENRYENSQYDRDYDEPYYRGYRYERSYNNEPYWSRDYDNYLPDTHGSYATGWYEYGRRYNEPYRRSSSYEGRYGEQYDRGRYGRGDERGFLERARDEIKSWFGDDEAERRRRMDEM